MKAEWVTAIAGVVVAIGVIPQLISIARSLKHQSLTNVLAIESEMNARKAEVDELQKEIMLCDRDKLDESKREGYESALAARKENWYNAVETLCFCINKAYINERDWRAQYRDYVANIVKGDEKKFGNASVYTNIIDLNNKWKRG